jgi:hypothetical protein
VEPTVRLPYEAPLIVDTFDALEVMGAAEGAQCGTGSQVDIIAIACD